MKNWQIYAAAATAIVAFAMAFGIKAAVMAVTFTAGIAVIVLATLIAVSLDYCYE